MHETMRHFTLHIGSRPVQRATLPVVTCSRYNPSRQVPLNIRFAAILLPISRDYNLTPASRHYSQKFPVTLPLWAFQLECNISHAFMYRHRRWPAQLDPRHLRIYMDRPIFPHSPSTTRNIRAYTYRNCSTSYNCRAVVMTRIRTVQGANLHSELICTTFRANITLPCICTLQHTAHASSNVTYSTYMPTCMSNAYLS
jgi:hypothetical protein